jgi:hypothetical protein
MILAQLLKMMCLFIDVTPTGTVDWKSVEYPSCEF